MNKSRYTWVPEALTFSRLLFGPALPFLVLRGVAPVWLFGVLAAALLSDIFDGVIARRLGVADSKLRLADSLSDLWFFSCAGTGMFIAAPQMVLLFTVPLLIEMSLQCASYLFDIRRYGKVTYLHAYSAKFWGLSLYLAAMGVLVWHTPVLMWLAFGAGILAAVDALAIKLILPDWRHDVVSIAHARRIRHTSAQ